MTKGLAIVAALLVGGASLALAQGQPTGAYPPVAGGAAGNPATNPVSPGPPGPGVIPGGAWTAVGGFADQKPDRASYEQAQQELVHAGQQTSRH